MSEMTIVQTRKSHVGIRVIQSLNVGITTTWMETIVALNIDVVRRGVLIESIAKLGSGSNGVSIGRNLSWISTLLAATIRVIGIPQMMFKSNNGYSWE